jgi:hypothetical protein
MGAVFEEKVEKVGSETQTRGALISDAIRSQSPHVEQRVPGSRDSSVQSACSGEGGLMQPSVRPAGGAGGDVGVGGGQWARRRHNC